MSAKFMHVFTDENPELQKQIGCMSGIFHMFDHHHLITRRRLTARSHKRLPSDHGLMNISVVGSERNASSPQIVQEKTLSKSMYENQRVSMESSRTSFSSSSCSSFSSLECKSTQQDFPIFDQAIFQERSLKTSPRLKNSVNDTRVNSKPRNNLPNASVHSTRQSLDFQEVVKDSIYRGSRGLSVKTSTKEDVKKHVLKHRDSPRPAYMIGTDRKPRMPMDWYFSGAGEPPRSSFEAKDVQFNPVLRESPRFSYDGREISRTSLDSGEHRKPTSRLRELPRLSLDSREGSMKNSNFESKPNSSLKDLDGRSMNQVSADSNVHQGLGLQKRSSSVVAKLMGLEAMPNLSLAAQESMELAKTYTKIDCASYESSNFILKSADAIQDSKQNQVSRSPTISLEDPVTRQLVKPHSVMKPVSNSRVPIETAPWRQPDRVHVPFGNQEAHLKQRPESVYSEIEKRLKELKFRQSNKDHRALKQILDAMQAKGLLETKKDEEHSEVSVHKSHSNQTPTRGDQNLKSANVRRRQISHPDPLMKGNNSPKAFESPIVIMKPAKSVNISGFYASSAIPSDALSGLRKLRTTDHMDKRMASAKEQIPKASSTELSNQPHLSTIKNSINKSGENSSERTQSRMVQYSYRPQSPRENCGSSVKTPSSLSPRLQQRKHETERKLCRSLPSSESKKPQKPSVYKQPSELVSPRGKLRRKSTKVQENDDQLSESSETRNSSQQGDEVSLRLESNIVPASQVDVEVTIADRSLEMNLAFLHQGSLRTSEKAANNASSVLKKKYSLNLNEEVSTTEPVAVASEQPSPISVLDASFYQDDLPPSPLNKSSDAFKDDNFRASDEHWNLASGPNATLPISHKKLVSIQKLVQKLSELSSCDGGSPTTDHIASLCESQNPDHRYVSEILLASGLLLNDLSDEPMSPMPLQLHPSGQLINPDLFLVLEQRKSGCLSEHETVHKSTLQRKPDPEKLHRKLVFDVVNEILIQKLELTSRDHSIDLLNQAKTLPRRFPSGQRLLRELCLEIEQLQAASSRGDSIDDDNSIGGENVSCKLEGWADFGREVPGVVLEIERSIFKDLIDEVLSNEAASSLQSKLSRRRRQLFSK